MHIMVDLETMGTRVDAPILSIGACAFDPATGKIEASMYIDIDIEDAFRHGKPSASTVKWWLQQDSYAQKAVVSGKAQLFDALKQLRDFYGRFPDAPIWSNGATFDIAILDFAFPRVLNEASPWKFWLVRDMRTIVDIAGGIPADLKKNPSHNAIEDAHAQALIVSVLWRKLRGITTPLAPPPAKAQPIKVTSGLPKQIDIEDAIKASVTDDELV
jgi:hypothetical protein